MLTTLTLFLLLAGACAWEKSWRANFFMDRLLPTIGLVEIPLHDISFDVDHKVGTFTGFAEFHLVRGTLGNLHKRVRRQGDCIFYDHAKVSKTGINISCLLSLAGLVAKYNVEVIVDRKSTWVVAEVLVDYGSIRVNMLPEDARCQCTDVYHYVVNYVSARMMPMTTDMELPANVIREFKKEIVSHAEIEIARALNTTYKAALTAKAQILREADLLD